jgi:hypothetical protein
MWDSWNTRVWWLQLTVAVAWAGLIVFLWLGWTGAALRDMPAGDGGLAVLLTMGCCGFTWVVGLVPIVLCFWILKE